MRVISAYLIHYLIHGLLFLHSLLFVHRLSQISTDYFLARKSTAFSKTRLGYALTYTRHFVITACFASSRLSLLCGNEQVYTFSIALMQIKPLSIAQLAVPFSKPCPSVPKKFLIGFPSGRRTSFPNFILARMNTALKKARLAARWVKAIFAKGYTESIDTARYRRAN